MIWKLSDNNSNQDRRTIPQTVIKTGGRYLAVVTFVLCDNSNQDMRMIPQAVIISRRTIPQAVMNESLCENRQSKTGG